MVYSTSSLGNDEIVSNKAIAVLYNDNLSIQSSESMETISIYDITGRKIQSYDASHNTVFNTSFNYPQAVYIAKIALSTGKTVTVKLLNH